MQINPLPAIPVTFAVILLVIGCQTVPKNHSELYLPEGGIIKNESIAIAVSEVLLASIYGSDQIERQKPFSATLEKGIWTVTGHFPTNLIYGGVAEIRIREKDGKVLGVIHSE